MSGVSRSSVVDRNICHFMWYGGGAGDGLRSGGEEALPHPRACALSCPSPTIGGPGSLGHGHLTRPAVVAHNTRRYGHSPSGSPGPIGAARCGHSRRRELRLYGVLRSSSPTRNRPDHRVARGLTAQVCYTYSKPRLSEIEAEKPAPIPGCLGRVEPVAQPATS